MPPGAIDPGKVELARSNFRRAGLEGVIEQHHADAAEFLDELDCRVQAPVGADVEVVRPDPQGDRRRAAEGARIAGDTDMSFESEERDQYGHKKLGGIGDRVAARLKELSPKYNSGHRVNIVNQRLGYLVRCGEPDAIDSIVPMAYGNLALDLILSGTDGRLVTLKNGRYDNAPISVVTRTKKVVDVQKFYNTERLRPIYQSFEMRPMLIMTSEG